MGEYALRVKLSPFEIEAKGEDPNTVRSLIDDATEKFLRDTRFHTKKLAKS